MVQRTQIEWADATWNPVTGCTKIGPGCDRCYAERFAERWRGVPNHPYEQGFDLKLWPSRISFPLSWKKPRKIFVNSMSDLFHKNIAQTFVDQIFDTIEKADWHIYQILTKRSSLMRNYLRLRYGASPIPSHIWPGVSVEDAHHTTRIHHLLQINSSRRFISFEPLIAPIGDVDLQGIAWAIVGGESGPGARKMEECWVTQLRDVCHRDDVAFFFKQWGGLTPKASGRSLEGKEWNNYPVKVIHDHTQ